ncbi:MAG TPA: condensation domain-containing protein, partial [Longimicrobiaceae bacterium]|nr:condensation domain-containing protein [Longimicrobiaceae bacterium]
MSGDLQTPGPTVEDKRHLLAKLLRTRVRKTEFPLSFAQRRLWFLDRYEEGGSVYNLPAALRLGGELDVRALERGLAELLRRHESLRTVFRAAEAAEGEPVQVVQPAAPQYRLVREDLSALGAQAREAAVLERVRADAREGFDLERGPLFRARLLR